MLTLDTCKYAIIFQELLLIAGLPERIISMHNGVNAMTMPAQSHSQYDANASFELAIASGRLSADPKHPNYAGNYMFMGRTADGRGDAFKHCDTRQYLPL